MNRKLSKSRFNKRVSRKSKNLNKKSKRNYRKRVNRRGRTKRTRSIKRRQRGGFTTTSVFLPTTSSMLTTQAAQTNLDCALRNNASIFQSTFNPPPNSDPINTSNYSLINNEVEVYIKQ